jgi:hypothetical protein
VCTVVTRWIEGEPVTILAIRDEFVSREFDDPGAWWPDRPNAIGGRDRRAGGSWCVSDVASGTTALVLNRPEKQVGTPSRGVLPLAAVDAGERWTEQIDHREMASFTLVLAGPGGVSAWSWDAVSLRRHEFPAGTHVFTSRGVDSDDEKARALAPRFASRPWLDVATEHPPVDDRTALIVRHPFETDTYATVFGQLITARPSELRVSLSRTPWIPGSWMEAAWTS